MNISFEIPQDIEHELTADGADLNAKAKEAYLVDLSRQHRISHFQIGQALGLSRYETDGVLTASWGRARHHVRGDEGPIRISEGCAEKSKTKSDPEPLGKAICL